MGETRPKPASSGTALRAWVLREPENKVLQQIMDHQPTDSYNNALLGTLSHLAGRFAEARDAQDMLAALVQGARGLLPYTAAALALDTEAGWQIFRAAVARPMTVTQNGSVPQAAAETLDRFMEHGQPLRINDMLAPPWRDSAHRDILWKDGTRSALLVPLRAGDALLGTLSFTSVYPDQYPPEKYEVATFLAWMVTCTLRAQQASAAQPAAEPAANAETTEE